MNNNYQVENLTNKEGRHTYTKHGIKNHHAFSMLCIVELLYLIINYFDTKKKDEYLQYECTPSS